MAARTRFEGLTRRELLKLSLAASAGMLIGDRLGWTPAFARSRRVVVVGAGFSGLAAAHELKASGYDVTVVESRNRVGGRVLTLHDFVPGKNVEAGGELIGASHLTWLGFAKRFGLTFVDVEDTEDVYVFDGRRLADTDAARLVDEMEDLQRRMTADSMQIADPFAPWTTRGAEALDRRSLGDWLHAVRDRPQGVAALSARLSSDNGVPVASQSYLANLSIVKAGGGDRFWTDSELWHCAEGNHALASRLHRAIGASRVRLGTPVSAIRAAPDGVVVELSDGSALHADDVIVTIPPSAWHRVAFDPPLPPE